MKREMESVEARKEEGKVAAWCKVLCTVACLKGKTEQEVRKDRKALRKREPKKKWWSEPVEEPDQ